MMTTYMMIVWRLPNDCLTTAWRLPDDCQTSAWILHDDCLITTWQLLGLGHGLRTPREEIAFTARPKIHSHSQIFGYGQSIFCLPHRPNLSDIFELCLRWVSVVRAAKHLTCAWEKKMSLILDRYIRIHMKRCSCVSLLKTSVLSM